MGAAFSPDTRGTEDELEMQRSKKIVLDPEGLRYVCGDAALDLVGRDARWVQRGSVEEEEVILRHMGEDHGTYVLDRMGQHDLAERLDAEALEEFRAEYRRIIRRLMEGWEIRVRYIPRYADGDFWYAPRGVLVSPDGERERVSDDVVDLFVSPPGCDWRKWNDFPAENRAYWAQLVGAEGME